MMFNHIWSTTIRWVGLQTPFPIRLKIQNWNLDKNNIMVLNLGNIDASPFKWLGTSISRWKTYSYLVFATKYPVLPSSKIFKGLLSINGITSALHWICTLLIGQGGRVVAQINSKIWRLSKIKLSTCRIKNYVYWSVTFLNSFHIVVPHYDTFLTIHLNARGHICNKYSHYHIINLLKIHHGN